MENALNAVRDFLPAAGAPAAKPSLVGLSRAELAEVAARQMKSGGPMIGFEIEGGKAGAFRFANALELVLISNNLGDAKSLITHPATTTHHRLTEDARQALGISGGFLRISVGLEAVEDLIGDIDAALERV